MNNDDSKTAPAPTRRRFLTGLGGVAAAGATVAAGGLLRPAISPALEASTDPALEEPAGEGYRLTEHVKKYYRTTIL